MSLKKTVLEIVQDVLNDTSGDEVNSINDTVESLQIANIVASTYNFLMSTRDWPHTKNLYQLIASGDIDKPTHMTLPDRTSKVEHIYYNSKLVGDTKDKYSEIKYKEPDDFLRFLNYRDSTSTDIKNVTDDSGVVLHIRNDMNPSYYTSFDDETLVFDSYLDDVDSTLQGSKTQAILYVSPTFVLSDGHTPDLPSEAFNLLIEEVKSRASVVLHQTANPKAEQASKASNRWLSMNNWKVNGGIKYPDYGRK